MTRRYSAARPVSDPVASRNATIKMIQRCAKHQPQADSFGEASRLDDYVSFTAWGAFHPENNSVTPAIAIKEVNDLYIMRKLHPTRPVSLVPSEWYFSNGAWAYYEVPRWFDNFTPPSQPWFTLEGPHPIREWNVDRPTPEGAVAVRDHVLEFMRLNMEVPPAIAEAWARIRRELTAPVVERAERIITARFGNAIVTARPDEPVNITYIEE